MSRCGFLSIGRRQGPRRDISLNQFWWSSFRGALHLFRFNGRFRVRAYECGSPNDTENALQGRMTDGFSSTNNRLITRMRVVIRVKLDEQAITRPLGGRTAPNDATPIASWRGKSQCSFATQLSDLHCLLSLQGNFVQLTPLNGRPPHAFRGRAFFFNQVIQFCDSRSTQENACGNIRTRRIF